MKNVSSQRSGQASSSKLTYSIPVNSRLGGLHAYTAYWLVKLLEQAVFAPCWPQSLALLACRLLLLLSCCNTHRLCGLRYLLLALASRCARLRVGSGQAVLDQIAVCRASGTATRHQGLHTGCNVMLAYTLFDVLQRCGCWLADMQPFFQLRHCYCWLLINSDSVSIG
jgi:hypothetical protein